uniref:Large ribosomal subunit protein bL32 n=1 Tax=Leptospirillum sp. Group II '5-way CG' TaxID=419541 RepID=B6AL33_9BACT|nr:MAG: Ribosomal protein S32 [Leptospirillum sp. Group II '5-way CG']
MAHPKTKISRTRRDKRRTHKKLVAGPAVTCPNCGMTKNLIMFVFPAGFIKIDPFSGLKTASSLHG